MAENDIWIMRAIIGALVGIYGWFLKHISTSKKHPCKDDITEKFDKVVFQDVCDERSKGIRDCIENEIVSSKERYETLTETMKGGFDRMDKRLERIESK